MRSLAVCDQDRGVLRVRSGVVSERAGGRDGAGVLPAPAIDPKGQAPSAPMPDAVPVVFDIFHRAALQRRAARYGMSLWLPRGAPAARVHEAQHGILQR